jgi:predicted aspartyl protease
LAYLRQERIMLANGVIEECALHQGVVLWDGQERAVPIQASAGSPLIGMGLMRGHELTVQVMDGGNVTLRALP